MARDALSTRRETFPGAGAGWISRVWRVAVDVSASLLGCFVYNGRSLHAPSKPESDYFDLCQRSVNLFLSALRDALFGRVVESGSRRCELISREEHIARSHSANLTL